MGFSIPRSAKRGHDHLIEKNLPSSFTNTDLHGWLTSMDIDSVVICGYMTHMCCDTTARQAMHLGLGVEFLSDATGTLSISNQAGTVTAEELQRATLVTQAARFSVCCPPKNGPILYGDRNDLRSNIFLTRPYYDRSIIYHEV